MNVNSAYICMGDWGYCVTDDGNLVPHICPDCGSTVRLDKRTQSFRCGNGHELGTYSNKMEIFNCFDGDIRKLRGMWGV